MPFTMSPMYTLFTVLGSIYPPLVVSEDRQDKMYPLSKYYSTVLEETGYLHLQATKPDTIGKIMLVIEEPRGRGKSAT